MIQMVSVRPLAVVAVLLALYQVVSLQKTSALRMCDSSDCELQLTQMSTTFYYFSIPTAHLFANRYFVFCFRERLVVPADSQTCTLMGLDNSYKCVGITPNISGSTVTGVTMTNWTADSTLSNPNRTGQVPYNGNTTTLVTQILIDIKNLTDTNKIYETYVGYVPDLLTDSRSKNAFFMTFQLTNQTSSDNLFMQRNVACCLFYYKQYQNYNLIFYGGVVRGGNDTLFVHVLSYLYDSNASSIPSNVTSLNLNVWIGISYSAYGHPGRDAMVFISDNYTTWDMYSLYYAAPYLDTSLNILGTSDVIDTGDSNSHSSVNTSFFYWTGGSRKYVTGDTYGDEILMKKMNATMSYSIGYNPSTGPYSPLVAANKHNFTSSFYFNVAVWESHILLKLLTLVMSYVVLA